MAGEYIAHHGTEGQKWYKRNYQYPDGTYTELGKARRRVGNGERKPLLTEAEKIQRRESYYDKKEAIRKGDVLYANKHLSEFSNQELDDIVERYSKNKRIAEIAAAIENQDKLTIEKIAKKLETVSNIAGSSANIAKSIDTMHRSFSNISNRDKDSNWDKKGSKKKDKKKKKKYDDD